MVHEVKHKYGTFFIGLLLTTLIFSGMLMLAPDVGAADREPGRLYVSARSEIKVEPDIAVFTVGTETRADTLEEARNENAKAMEGVIRRLLEAGAEESDIKTRGFQVRPEWHYDRDEGTQTLMGYRVHHSFEVTVTDLDILGELMDAAMEEGANQVSTPVFGLRNTEELELKALEEAVRKARNKADVLARASGTYIKRIVSISEQVMTPYGGDFYAARSPMMAMEVVQDSAATSISPGEISITASVTITYEL